MRSRRKSIAAVVLAALCLVLPACSAKVTFEPTETSIFVQEDRHIIGAEIEPFDNSAFDTPRYSDTELIAFVEDAVRDFNEEKAGQAFVRAEEVKDQEDVVLPVAINRLEVSEGVATLILEYDSAATYLEFNGRTDEVPVQNLIVGTINDGINSGLDFENMVKVDEGAEAGDAAYDETTHNKQYNLVAVNGDTVLKVCGEIVFMTKGMTLLDAYTVKTTEGTNYIVYK